MASHTRGNNPLSPATLTSINRATASVVIPELHREFASGSTLIPLQTIFFEAPRR